MFSLSCFLFSPAQVLTYTPTLHITDQDQDAILTSKWNKPFPVTMIPSAIGLYLAEKQGERQRQILDEIRAVGTKDLEAVKAIAAKPR